MSRATTDERRGVASLIPDLTTGNSPKKILVESFSPDEQDDCIDFASLRDFQHPNYSGGSTRQFGSYRNGATCTEA
jgi:hypothetical protein